jgi:hypothetical protein
MYKTVFDLTQSRLDLANGIIPMCFLFLFVGILMLILRKHIPQSRERVLLIGIAFIVMPSLFILILLIPNFLAPSRARRIINERKYMVVEGKPENYHPMPSEGHDEESFDMQGVHFHYSDYTSGFGYHNAASKGGVIKPNNYYRITYYPDQDSLEAAGPSILKIELRE